MGGMQVARERPGSYQNASGLVPHYYISRRSSRRRRRLRLRVSGAAATIDVPSSLSVLVVRLASSSNALHVCRVFSYVWMNNVCVCDCSSASCRPVLFHSPAQASHSPASTATTITTGTSMMSSAALTGYDDRWNQGTPAIAAAVTSGQPLYPAPPVDMDDVHQHARAQLPPAVNSSIPIDPSLAASWPTYYAPYPPNPSLQAAQQLQAAHSAVLPRPTSSTSSRPAESPQSQLDSGSLASNANGKRPAAPAVSSSRKKTRTLKSEGDDDAFDDEPSPTIDKDEKSKPTRGTRHVSPAPPDALLTSFRACTVCRRLKMKCIDANNPPCRRCLNGNHECVFEESNRGKRNPKYLRLRFAGPR